MVEGSGERPVGTPREELVRRLGALWALAGDPTMERVARAANERGRGSRAATARGTVRVQRISAWKRGDNVPAQFDSLRPVLLTLIDLAGQRGAAGERELVDIRAWQQLWRECDSWTPELAVNCPYAGLDPYRSADADWFFGRERATGELVELVTATEAGGGGIVVVVGASGAGKSSLLAAGLVPALGKEWAIASGTPWRMEDSAAGPDPDDSDRRELTIIDQFEEVFTSAPDDAGRTRVLQRLADRADAGQAVVIGVRADFFARCLETPELVEACTRRTFVLGPMRGDEISAAITEPARRAGLRLEPGLAELIAAELVGLGQLSGTEGSGTLPLLSHVMESVWRVRDKNQLTIAGYRAAGGVAGSVAHTATAAWAKLNAEEQAAAKDLLLRMVNVGDGTRDTRRRVSRDEILSHAVHSEDAAAAFETLTQARLITVDDDTAYLAHEIVLDAWPQLREWLDADREGHLIRQRTAADAADWERSGRSGALLYRGDRLEGARHHRREPARSAAESDRGTAAFLDAAMRARKRRIGAQAAIAFAVVLMLVVALIGYLDTRAAGRERDEVFFHSVVSEADRVQGSDPTLSAELTVLAHRMRPDDSDVDSRLIASQNLPIASSFADHPGKLSGMAFVGRDLVALAGDDHRIRLWPADGARGSRQAAPAIDEPADRTVMLLSAGNLLLSVDSDHRVRIRDLADPAHPALLQTLDTGDAVSAASLTRDGHLLAVVHQHDVTIWDISDPTAPRALPGRLSLDGLPYGAAFLGDDRGLLVAVNRIQGGFGSVRSITVSGIDPVHGISNTTTVAQGSAGIGAIPLGTGRMVAVGDDEGHSSAGGSLGSVVRFARVEESGALTPVGTTFTVAGADALTGATVSPDGSMLATMTTEGTTLWNLADLSQPTVLGTQLAGASARCVGGGHACAGGAFFGGFTPDGREFVTGLTNGTVQRWSIPRAVLAGQSGPIDSLSNGLSGDGRRMITLAPGTDAHIWDIENPADVHLLGTIPQPDAALPGISATAVPGISADGRFVALLMHGVLTLIDISDPAKPAELAHFPGAAGGAFAAGRPYLATIVPLPTPEMLFWDISNPAAPVRIGGPVLIPVSQQLMSDGLQLAQTRDGQLAVSLTDKLQVWNAFVQNDSRSPIGTADAARDLGEEGLAVSPNHRTAVTGWNSGTVRLWNIADPARIAALGEPLPVSSISVDSVDFSADGSRLATGGTDATVRLWDTSDPAHPKALGQSITQPSSAGWRVAFHPKANFLVGAGDNGVLRVWDLDAEHAVRRVCALTRETIAAQLADALPGHSLPSVCD